MFKIRNRIISPFENIQSENFSGFLSMTRWLKRLGWVFFILGLLLTVPRWVTTLVVKGFELDLAVYALHIYAFWLIPILFICISNLFALLISSEEKLRTLTQRED